MLANDPAAHEAAPEQATARYASHERRLLRRRDTEMALSRGVPPRYVDPNRLQFRNPQR